MTHRTAAFRVATVMALLAGALTVLASTALAKKPSEPAPRLTDALLILDCDTGDSIHSYVWANVSGRWVVKLTWLVDRPDGSYEEIKNWRTVAEDEQPDGSHVEAGWWPDVPDRLTMRVALAKGTLRQGGKHEAGEPMFRTVTCSPS